MIKRDKYLNLLIAKKWNGMIKVVTGIRRCGKSHLLFNIFKNYLLDSGVKEDQIIEVILDSVECEGLRDRKNLNEYIKSKIIDERQYLKNFIVHLKAINQKHMMNILYMADA